MKKDAASFAYAGPPVARLRKKPGRAWQYLALLILLVSLPVQGQTFLSAEGSKIIDANKQEVILKGMGLGGWLLMEGYMMQVDGGYGQWQIKRGLSQQGSTPAEVETFFSNWRNAHTTEADIRYLKSLGFNCVRLPMHYDLFLTSSQRAERDKVAYGTQSVSSYVELLSGWYDQNQLFTDLTVPGFSTADSSLRWAGANQMWVILDMHAAPGGQGADPNINDALVGLDLYNRVDAKGRKIYQLVLERLWKTISARYKSDERVAMYDLLNEPHGSVPMGSLKAIYDKVIGEIRGNGDNHLILLEGLGYGNEHTGMTPDLFPGQTNLVWSGHRYWVTNDSTVTDANANQLNLIANLANFSARWNVPVWVGETGENSNHWIAEACRNLNNKGIGWCLWTHKRLRGSYYGANEQTASPMKITYENVYTSAGRAALLQAVQYANCIRQPDVEDAMTRLINDATPIPFKGTRINLPGKVFASDFDLGKNGIAYHDVVYQKIPYDGEGWNNGYSYRNDGPDVQGGTLDTTGNGVNLGWIENSEWVSYSVRVTQSGEYAVQFNVANGDARLVGSLTLKVDGASVGTVNVAPTGGWQTWTKVTMPGSVALTAGDHTVQVACNSTNGGGNLSWFSFTDKTGLPLVTGVTNAGATARIKPAIQVSPNPFKDRISVKGVSEQSSLVVFDLAGRQILTVKNFLPGHDLGLSALPAGAYILKVVEGTGSRSVKIIKE